MQKIEEDVAALEAEGAKADIKTQGARRRRARGQADPRPRRSVSSTASTRCGSASRRLKVQDLEGDEILYREMKNRFGKYFEGYMGAEAIKRACRLRPRRPSPSTLREIIQTGKGQRKTRALKRLKVVVGVPQHHEQPDRHGAGRRPGHPAGPAPDGAARRRPLRDLRPQRPLPPRHQPQQPPQATARPRRARDHRQQREADAAGGRRLAVRQRTPWASGHRPGQPAAEVDLGHAQGQAGPVPPEPARQARRLLGPFGHRGRPAAQAAPVRPAEGRWRWSCSSRS